MSTPKRPTCATCRFWESPGPPIGRCRLSSSDPDADLPPVEQRLFASVNGIAVTTHQTFGCAQWERVGTETEAT